MRFIKKVIGPDEKLVGICSIHWIYGLKGLMMMSALMLFGLWLDTSLVGFFDRFRSSDGFIAIDLMGQSMFWICTAVGVAIFLPYFIMMIATEIGLTNKRIIYKTGLIFVDVKEVDLEEIKAASVNNGAFGRILNYGYIQFDARFIENISIPAITDPYRFVKALNEMRSQIKEDSMTIVVEGHGTAGSADVKTVSEDKEEPQPHKLDADRYKGTETTAAEAVRGLLTESVETMDTLPEPAALPDKAPQLQKGKAAKNPKKEKKPMVFNKQALKQRILNSFSDITSN